MFVHVRVYRFRREWRCDHCWELWWTCQVITAAYVSATFWGGRLSSATCSSSPISWVRYESEKVHEYCKLSRTGNNQSTSSQRIAPCMMRWGYRSPFFSIGHHAQQPNKVTQSSWCKDGDPKSLRSYGVHTCWSKDKVRFMLAATIYYYVDSVYYYYRRHLSVPMAPVYKVG